MSFFFVPAKAAPKAPKKVRLRDIPVASLQKMGCEVCPRDKDAVNLHSPKMRASGPQGASVYLLGSAPSQEEDEDDNHWTDKAGEAIYRAFGAKFMESRVRSNFVTQCRGDQTQVEVECCRPRIIADIELVRPEIVVTIGDAPLAWATGATSGALTNRGSLFAARIGSHACWVYSVMYPNFVNKKGGYGKSEYELALEHDAARVRDLVGRLPPPRIYDAPYDRGIECITGTKPGDMQRLEKALDELARESRSAIDIETSGLRPYMQEDPLLLTCAVGTFARTVAFSVDHPDGWGSGAQRKRVRALLHNYLLSSGRKVAHNLAFEMEWFRHEFGPSVLRRAEWDDTMAMAHTLDERSGSKSLDAQTRMRFGFGLKAQSHVDVKRPRWWMEYPLEDILRYNGMDAKWTDLLRDTLAPQVAEENQAEYERKVRLAPTLVLTETAGLVVDFDYAQQMADKFTKQTRDVEARIARCPEVKQYSQRYGTFSPTNPEHVLKLLRDVCKRPEVKSEDRKTKAVRWTTDEEALSSIPAGEVPSVPLILEHRGSSKLSGTYIEPVLRREIVCRDGLIRCKYSSMVAETGRLNSEDPNAQNWPVRKHREVRGMVVARRRHWLAACDYGQIEFRVIGMASGDRNLVKYCWTGYDVHGDWAARFIRAHGPIVDWVRSEFAETLATMRAKAGKEYDEDKAILKTLRLEAKNRWVFPQFFGGSFRMCAEQMHTPVEIAEDLAGEFWDEFPGVKEWQRELMRKYELDLCVETLGGRKRRGPLTLNQIINHPIQGTAADIVLEGMNAVSELADATEDPDLQPVLNVHDDLTFDIPDENLGAKLPIIAREMCMPRFDYINVPLIVEVKVGTRWHELEEVQVFRSNEIFGIPNPYA